MNEKIILKHYCTCCHDFIEGNIKYILEHMDKHEENGDYND